MVTSGWGGRGTPAGSVEEQGRAGEAESASANAAVGGREAPSGPVGGEERGVPSAGEAEAAQPMHNAYIGK